ncbi:MAG TPA: SCO family protein [Acidimicrobiales bacterium]|jgi:cytochrome oxidase Cu insertion factor (SCO1/SenC/PrrC family)|nr:SCO family protein [Acidimicrobiales bacterium]
MPGMGRTLQTGNSIIVSSFHNALLHQLLIILLVALICAIGFNVVRTIQWRRLKAHGLRSFPTPARPGTPEPLARRVVRIGFAALWILDGLLQIQSGMPLGLTSGVVQPAAATSPPWVQHLVNSGVTIWSNHPVEAAAAAVWIQLGIGIWLLVAPRGRWSRLAGLASVGWGLVVWVFGEAFGGIFAPGLTWMFGAPGAVLFYCVGGVLVALPEHAFSTARLGRIIVRAGGIFLLGMAILQAWPGRGYWQGRNGTLNAMVQQMAQTSQPHVLSSWLGSFGALVQAHGWGVNLFVVIALTGVGALFVSERRELVLGGLVAFVVLSLADWVLVEDLGFLGGVGTDPNSMIPMALVLVTGYLAMVRLPVPLPVAEEAPDGAAVTTQGEPDAGPGSAIDGAIGSASEEGTSGGWWDRVTLSYLLRSVAAVAALAIVLVGAAPMAMASVNRNADPILSEALDGTPNAVDTPAPSFTLTDQHGQSVSLSRLRGHVVALTFLDPVCTSDCPLIAQEFRQTDQQLGDQSHQVDFVAIVANPIYRSVSFTNAFDHQEGLTHLQNWYYLTGSLSALERVWNDYGVEVSTVANGAMVAHSDIAFVIDSHGRQRDALITDPGPTQVFASSFSSLLLSQIDQLLNT